MDAIRTIWCNWLFRLQNCMRTWKNVCPSSTWMCQRMLKLWITPARTGWSSSFRLESVLHILGWTESPVITMNTHTLSLLYLRWPSLGPTIPTTLLRQLSLKTWPPKSWAASIPEPQWWYNSGIFLQYIIFTPCLVTISTAQVLHRVEFRIN